MLNKKIAGFFEDIKSLSILDPLQGVHSFVIMKDSKIISQGELKPYSISKQHMLFSLSKSFLSMGIGIAQSEGYLSVNDTVSKYLSKDFPKESNEYLDKLNIRHLLSIKAKDKTQQLKLAYNMWKKQENENLNDFEENAVCAAWTRSDQLTIIIRKVSTPFTEMWVFTFNEDKLIFEKFEGPSFGDSKPVKIIAARKYI